jgi:hypothetical protein
VTERRAPYLVLLLIGSLLLSVGDVAAHGALGGHHPTSSPALGLTLQGTTSVFLGEGASFWANATGGSAPYLFHWALNGSEVFANISAAGADERLTFRPLGDAIYVIAVNVTDGGGNRTALELSLQVTGPSPVSVVLGVLSTNSNGSITFHATVAGGTPPYEYRWSAPGASAGWRTTGNFTTSALASGTYHISVLVRDSNGYLGGSALTVGRNVANPFTIPADYLLLVVGLLVGFLIALAALRYRRRREPVVAPTEGSWTPPLPREPDPYSEGTEDFVREEHAPATEPLPEPPAPVQPEEVPADTTEPESNFPPGEGPPPLPRVRR